MSGGWRRSGLGSLPPMSSPRIAVLDVDGTLVDSNYQHALAWYRAAGTLTTVEVGAITVPTLYIWGDRDATVGPTAARLTADFVSGPFRFETLPGVGHFVTDEAPAAVTSRLLSHLGAQR